LERVSLDLTPYHPGHRDAVPGPEMCASAGRIARNR
jgi:hypothetical protein